jgi:hypothetical protein
VGGSSGIPPAAGRLGARSAVVGGSRESWHYAVALPCSLAHFSPLSIGCIFRARERIRPSYLRVAITLHPIEPRACVNNVVDVSAPPLDTCYASIAVQPLAVGGTEQPIAVSGTENAAYTTSSTSASAQSDDEVFGKDPMWTFLSRMRMITRIAELLQSKEVPSSQLHDEALVAICGILAMLGQRSPGAASAIV